jgi:SAM-dependent methyltransferase
MTCPLCDSNSQKFYDIYFRCPTCDGIFKDPTILPTSVEEKKHYENHQNNVNDLHYQNFVSPITNAIKSQYKNNTSGIDFGCGKAPVIKKVCEDNGYQMECYDIYFFPDKPVLEKKYDFVGASEVIEHFYNPKKEFSLLKSVLKPKGTLFLMTLIYDDTISFATWSYKIDPTHVFFYTKKTFTWIAQNYGFKIITIDKRLIILQKVH